MCRSGRFIETYMDEMIRKLYMQMQMEKEYDDPIEQRLREELGYAATAPFSGTVYDLAADACVYEAKGVRIQKAAASPKATRAARAYEKLVSLGRRLMSVIKKNEGCPNKDLDRFAREIQSLCDKWDRTDL